MAGKEPEAATFEEAMERAEAAARDLEAGDLPLEEALRRYEEGVKALKQCYEILRNAEKRIEVLVRDSEGNIRIEPFEPEEEEEEG